MFNEQEKLFLQTIQEMIGTNNKERKEAEENIKKWAKQTYIKILETCNKFIICEELELDIRRYACYIMTYLFKEENLEDWNKASIELKTQVQNNALGLLGNEHSLIRLSACTLVASLGKISFKTHGWPNLIKTLCMACESNEDKYKISSIKTLGMLWETVKKDQFQPNELLLMENTLIKVLSNPSSLELSLVSLKAYHFFLDYIEEKFQDTQYLQNTLKMFTAYCNILKDNSTKEAISVSISAIHRLSDIIICSYDYMEKYIKNITEFFVFICEGKYEELAIQGIIFFTELSEEEYRRKKEMQQCNDYMQSAWSILWPCIQNILNNKTASPGNDEYTRIKALSSLLHNISIVCEENIIDDIFTYMDEKIRDSNPLVINSAIYAFACIVETIHEDKIKKILPSSIEPLSNLFNLKNEELSRTVSWCFENLSKEYGQSIAENQSILSLFLPTIIINLKDGQLPNKTKIHLCTSLYNLTTKITGFFLQELGVFSKYLQELLFLLENLAYLPSSYDQEANLTKYCFIAISGFLESISKKDIKVVSDFMERLYNRLLEAKDLKNFNGNKEKQNEIQVLLCFCIQSLCKVAERIKIDYSKIEQFFNVIELYFKNLKGVFEEGLYALTSLTLIIPNQEFSHLLERLMVYIFYALDNYKDASNCKVALFCLIDIIQSTKENFNPYISKLMEHLQIIISSKDTNKELPKCILLIFSDLFTYGGESIWSYVQSPLSFMNNVETFCVNNCQNYISPKNDRDEYTYFLKLNENLMDLVSNVLKKLTQENNERKKAFESYVPNIFNYLDNMFQYEYFLPSQDYLLTCVSSLLDLLEIYNESILQLLKDNSMKRISQLVDATRDDETISLKDTLQNFIYVNKIKSFGSNLL